VVEKLIYSYFFLQMQAGIFLAKVQKERRKFEARPLERGYPVFASCVYEKIVTNF